MSTNLIIKDIVDRVKDVPGVESIVLGGSRANDTHTQASDIDIGIYYRSADSFDIKKLDEIASEIDDFHREGLVTSIGGWGPWINGGGWLKVNNMPVDFLYRDLNKVSTVVEDCIAGNISIDYQPGHPHGFQNSIYFGEIAICKPLWDPYEKIEKLKSYTVPYPKALKKAIINQFFWEANFSLENAKKGFVINDLSYISGCFFRCASCLTQVLFALNETFLINEKGAIKLASRFRYTPENLEVRINGIFESITNKQDNLYVEAEKFKKIVQEVETLIQHKLK